MMGQAGDGAERRAVVGLDVTGPLALQGRDAAAGLELWADADGVDLQIVDLGESRHGPETIYASWTRSDADLVLLPYGSGAVRDALSGVVDGRLVWNHGGSDDGLARRWAPMVLAPASTYFAPVVDLAARRGCRSVTIVHGPGRFARRVSEGAARRAQHLDLRAALVPLADADSHRADPDGALLVVGRFEDDVAIVDGLDERPVVTACVAAGIPAFGERLGAEAEGVLGPAQWWPDATAPELGPSGRDFADRYHARHGRAPSYVAAQAAAAGYLASAAARRSYTASEVGQWSTSTLLGAFEVDGDGRQVGHRVAVVAWRQGEMVRLA